MDLILVLFKEDIVEFFASVHVGAVENGRFDSLFHETVSYTHLGFGGKGGYEKSFREKEEVLGSGLCGCCCGCDAAWRLRL